MAERRCKTCDRECRSWDRMEGGTCAFCKTSARLGERATDDERRIAAPAIAGAPAPVVPVAPEPPPAAAAVVAEVPPAPMARVSLEHPPCRCGAQEGVYRTGDYSGWCRLCQDTARGRLKKRGEAPTRAAVLAELRDGPVRKPMNKGPRPAERRRRPPEATAPALATPAAVPDAPSSGGQALHYACPLWVLELRRRESSLWALRHGMDKHGGSYLAPSEDVHRGSAA